jgi:hypothetical protein
MRLLPPTLATLIACTLSSAGQDDPQAAARKDLLPRTVTFSKPTLPLQQALAEIKAQTGNRVADRRRDRTNPAVVVTAGPTQFWPALDAIGKASRIGFSPFLGEGEVVLTDVPYRASTMAHSGLFRIAHRRVALTLDEETQAHHCRLALDIAWEPRFRPFYIDLRQLKFTFAPDAKKHQRQESLPAHGPVGAAGRGAVELEVIAGAPDRTCPRIASVDGMVWAVGPSKMLTFRFTNLAVQKGNAKSPAAPSTVQDGVTVTIAALRRQTDALIATVQIENPKDTAGFDTHQSWLAHNRISLRQGNANKERVLHGGSTRESMRGNRATIDYEFADTPEQRVPSTLDGWNLEYETPGRIVEVTAPFTLKDIKLP